MFEHLQTCNRICVLQKFGRHIARAKVCMRYIVWLRVYSLLVEQAQYCVCMHVIYHMDHLYTYHICDCGDANIVTIIHLIGHILHVTRHFCLLFDL